MGIKMEIALGVIIIVLLIAIIVLQFMGKRTSDLSRITALLRSQADEQRDIVARQISDGATEQFKRFGLIQESVQSTLQRNREEVNLRLREFQEQLDSRLSANGQQVRETLQSSRTETNATLQENRNEINLRLREFQEQLDGRLSSIQRNNAENIEKINLTLESKMKSLQESNEKRLEQMQGVVDEKLQKTLETRLAQSFELVSRQLESVGQGLGEMRSGELTEKCGLKSCCPIFLLPPNMKQMRKYREESGLSLL